MKHFNGLFNLLAIIVVGSLLLTGCGRNSNANIELVREGHFHMNPSIKIGNAFDQYFQNGQWKAFKASDNADVVEFTGEFTDRDFKQTSQIYIQFLLNEGEQGNIVFNVHRMEIGGIVVDEATSTMVISKILSEYRPMK